MSISMTEKAANRAKSYLESRGKGVGLETWCKDNRLLWYGLCIRVC